MLITFSLKHYGGHSGSREIQGKVEGYQFKSEGKVIVFTDQNPIFLSSGLYISLIWDDILLQNHIILFEMNLVLRLILH